MGTDSMQTGYTQIPSFSFACLAKVHSKRKGYLCRWHSTWKRRSLGIWPQGMYPPIYQEKWPVLLLSRLLGWGWGKLRGPCRAGVPVILPATPLCFSSSTTSTWRLSGWPGSEGQSGSQPLVEASFHHLHGLVLLSPLRPSVCFRIQVSPGPSKAVWKLLVGVSYSYNSGDTISLEVL